MPFMIDGKFHGIITGFWEELPTGVIISIWEILENPRGILAALNSIGNLCWWADFCPWKHCSNMCALAAFPIFFVGLLCFFVGVLLCLILAGHVFLYMLFGVWNFCWNCYGVCFRLAFFGSVPGWPMFEILCDVFIAFCWFLCDCLEFVGLLWCLLLVCPKQQLLNAFFNIQR